MKLCLSCAHLFDTIKWRCPNCGNEPKLINGFPLFAPNYAHENAGFNPDYYKHLADLEESNFWFRTRNRLVVWAIEQYFPKVCRFLEIGCGTGYVLKAVSKNFPAAKLTGSEIFYAGLPFASKRLPQANLLQIDAREIPYFEHFDVLGAFDVLEHIEEDTKVLKEMYKAIRPGGGIILTVPQHPWLWSEQDNYACHVRRYTRTQLNEKVLSAGFKIIYQTSFVSLLLPLMWVSRKFGKAGKDPSQRSELHTAPLLNRILSVVMTLEFLTIRYGLRYLVGGSLLLVAKKA